MKDGSRGFQGSMPSMVVCRPCCVQAYLEVVVVQPQDQFADEDIAVQESHERVSNSLWNNSYGPKSAVVYGALKAINEYSAENGVDGTESCDHAHALKALYRASMELGPNHPHIYMRYIAYSYMFRIGYNWKCAAPDCTNENRYTTGYCGIHDLLLADGKGTKISDERT